MCSERLALRWIWRALTLASPPSGRGRPPTASISPAKASARSGALQRRIDRHQNQRQILTASEAPRSGRDHLGMIGEMKSKSWAASNRNRWATSSESASPMAKQRRSGRKLWEIRPDCPTYGRSLIGITEFSRNQDPSRNWAGEQRPSAAPSVADIGTPSITVAFCMRI